MQLNQVSTEYSVTGQIAADDVAAIAEAGFGAIICFRPDGEGGPDQPNFASVAKAAEAAGLQSRHIPAIPGQIGPAHVAETKRALGELPGPVLAYCASGARATALYQAAKR